MRSERKSTFPLKFKFPQVESIIYLSSKLTTISEEAFLLTVDVNIGALVSLTQFYDPALRCFSFQDF